MFSILPTIFNSLSEAFILFFLTAPGCQLTETITLLHQLFLYYIYILLAPFTDFLQALVQLWVFSHLDFLLQALNYTSVVKTAYKKSTVPHNA